MQLLDIDLRSLFGNLRLLCLGSGCIGRLADELIRSINALKLLLLPAYEIKEI